MTTLNATATLSGLIPFANYRVSVRCIWLDEIHLYDEYNRSSLTPLGYWSNASYISFTTQPDGRSFVLMCKIVANNMDVCYLGLTSRTLDRTFS